MIEGTVVQFGAGAIGRGFVGQLWSEAGYEVIFVDVDAELVALLNERRAYPLRLWQGSGGHDDLLIGPVRAVNGRDAAAVADEIARCAFACTAVGANVFPHLAPVLAAGIAARVSAGNRQPLNVICCENQAGAGRILRDTVSKVLSDTARAYFTDSVAFVDASVGRMVPPPSPDLLREDPLLVSAEGYKDLPIDGAAWIGPVPDPPHLLPRKNFAGYVARKLFTHNGGHALLAYQGYLAGHRYIWQAAEDGAIRTELDGFWNETGRALIGVYALDAAEQERHEHDLLSRFQNHALNDSVARVARDPLRKLRNDDRLVGAALLCLRYEPEHYPRYVIRAIVAALQYDAADDSGAQELQTFLGENDPRRALMTICGLNDDSPLLPMIEKAYNAARNR